MYPGMSCACARLLDSARKSDIIRDVHSRTTVQKGSCSCAPAEDFVDGLLQLRMTDATWVMTRVQPTYRACSDWQLLKNATNFNVSGCVVGQPLCATYFKFQRTQHRQLSFTVQQTSVNSMLAKGPSWCLWIYGVCIERTSSFVKNTYIWPALGRSSSNKCSSKCLITVVTRF